MQRGLLIIACDDLGIAERYVVYPRCERFPLRQGAQAVGLGELMRRLRDWRENGESMRIIASQIAEWANSHATPHWGDGWIAIGSRMPGSIWLLRHR